MICIFERSIDRIGACQLQSKRWQENAAAEETKPLFYSRRNLSKMIPMRFYRFIVDLNLSPCLPDLGATAKIVRAETWASRHYIQFSGYVQMYLHRGGRESTMLVNVMWVVTMSRNTRFRLIIVFWRIHLFSFRAESWSMLGYLLCVDWQLNNTCWLVYKKVSELIE
jgi:hypothetical protein